MDKILEFSSNHTLLVLALMVSFFAVVFSELESTGCFVAKNRRGFWSDVSGSRVGLDTSERMPGGKNDIH